MKNSIVRIENITINNFKNVVYGDLSLINNRKVYETSIVGLYGQNGSGKTALIDAIALLKFSLCGQSIPIKYADYINVDANYSELRYVLKINNTKDDNVYTIHYEFCIKKELDTSSQNTEETDTEAEKFKVAIFNEVLSYAST